MTDEQAMSSGETGRALARIEKAVEALSAEVRDRHHTLSNQMVAYIGPVAVLEKQAKSAEDFMMSATTRLNVLENQSAKVMAGATVLGFVAGLVPAWLKR